MFIKEYKEISNVKNGPHFTGSFFAVHFKVEADISTLFPYIHSYVKGALYFEKPQYIDFLFHKYRCILHPDEIVAGSFKEQEEVSEFIPKLIELLNDIYKRKDEIEPNYKQKRNIPVLDIYRLLPEQTAGIADIKRAWHSLLL